MNNQSMNNGAMMHEGKTSSDTKTGCCDMEKCCEKKSMCESKGGCCDMQTACCHTKMDCCMMKKGCCGGSCGKHILMIIISLIVIGGAFICGMYMGRNGMRHHGMDRGNMMGNSTMRAMYECMITDGATRDKCTDMMKTIMPENTTTTGTTTNQ